jgi:hypothetical protein
MRVLGEATFGLATLRRDHASVRDGVTIDPGPAADGVAAAFADRAAWGAAEQAVLRLLRE